MPKISHPIKSVSKLPESTVGILMEVKRPSNISQMISIDDINKTAFHELLLYYFNERIEKNNIDIKYLIVTNIYEWFIFDVSEFERLFFKNSDRITAAADSLSASPTRPRLSEPAVLSPCPSTTRRSPHRADSPAICAPAASRQTAWSVK